MLMRFAWAILTMLLAVLVIWKIVWIKSATSRLLSPWHQMFLNVLISFLLILSLVPDIHLFEVACHFGHLVTIAFKNCASARHLRVELTHDRFWATQVQFGFHVVLLSEEVHIMLYLSAQLVSSRSPTRWLHWSLMLFHGLKAKDLTHFVKSLKLVARSGRISHDTLSVTEVLYSVLTNTNSRPCAALLKVFSYSSTCSAFKLKAGGL